jgi:hypothetical protein
MAWDKTKPIDGAQVRTGDDEIRASKVDIQDALLAEHLFPINIGDPVALHSFGYGTTAERPAAGNAGRIYFNTDTGTIQYDDGAVVTPAWHDITSTRNIIPSGTVMAFIEAAAPAGWTQVITQDDQMLRVNSGSGTGEGGTWTIPADSSGAHTHSVSWLFNVSHSWRWWGMEDGDYNFYNNIAGHYDNHTHALDSQGAHIHTSNAVWRPAYLDTILCSKD